MFAVQYIVVKSALLIAVSKEVQYIVKSLRCVFLPPASPASGDIAWMAECLQPKSKTDFFSP